MATETSECAGRCARWMAELFASGSADETAGMSAAMANCRRVFAGVAAAEANEPEAAIDAAARCTKEV